MPISRMQMPRQLRRGGGIMDVVPRQGALLGGLKKAVKGVAKGVADFAKSDIGKAAIMAGISFGVPGTSFGGLFGRAGFGGEAIGLFGQKGIAATLGAIPGASSLAGKKTLGNTAKVFLGGSLLGGVLGEMSPEEQAEVTSGRNIGALRTKLINAYKNQRTFADREDEDSAIAEQVENDLAEYTSGAGGYAEGGRIGYAMGSDELVDQASGIMGLPQRTNKAGVKELDLRESGGFIPPVGVKEKADDIPAMLSNNEFVFTADAVRGMGNGNVNAGAQRMYDMMKKLEKGGRV